MKFPNRVREAREEKGHSRDELAALVGVTRQSIGLIETGRVCPSTVLALRMSRVLRYSVEELFWEPETTIPVKFVGEQVKNAGLPIRAYASSIREQVIARPVCMATVDSISHPVHGIVQNTSAHNGLSKLRLLQSSDSISRTVFVSGCDLGLGLLAKYTQKVSSHHQGVWFNTSNKQALKELADGFTHIAAVHYPDPLANTGVTTKLSFPCRQYHFATAELGWILPKGNPKRFRGSQDLEGGHFRLINREVGAGARELLDRELRLIGVVSEGIPGYKSIARGHLSVADAVANGFADVGVGHAGAAAVYGLDFIAVQQEACTLIVPEQYLKLEVIQVVMDALHSDVFRSELGSYGPYDLQNIGLVIS